MIERFDALSIGVISAISSGRLAQVMGSLEKDAVDLLLAARP
jgi:hypothetical protein